MDPMPQSRCPRCRGTDYYLADREMDFFVFNRLIVKNVKVMTCRHCGEKMENSLQFQMGLDKQEEKQARKYIFKLIGGIWLAVLSILAVVFLYDKLFL